MINEQISAYLDGEVGAQEAETTTAALLRDPALRQALSRQHWVRHALSDSRPVALDVDFSDRVLARLEADGDLVEQHANVIPLKKRTTPRRWRQVAGLAVAASLVGAVVLVNNPLGEPQVQQAAPVAQAQATAVPVAGRTQVALQSQTRPREIPADHWAVSDPDLENQLNGYLLEHDGLARGYGLSGATPSLVRVATYRQVGDR